MSVPSQLPRHIPVLLKEVREFLQGLQPLVDCTVGGGGHLKELLPKIPEEGQVLAIDRDGDMLRLTRDEIADERVQWVHGRFQNIDQYVSDLRPKAILADLGISNWQVDQASRGFSFLRGGPLDMRMDRTAHKTLERVIRDMSEKQLREALRSEADEKRATAIARRIKEACHSGNLKTTLDLSRLIEEVSGSGGARDPATRSFLALRRLVNEEGQELDRLLQKAPELLEVEGRLAIISFHSGEDRSVKNCFKDLARNKKYKILTPKPIAPSNDEVSRNPRSRSARLRVLEKVA